MAIQDDFSISAAGDVRYTGSGSNYTVITLHRWLGDLMDDAAASGNDILDITDATASERSTDNIITLNSPYNIDDVTAQHLYDGSVIQDSGNTIYDGILVFASTGAYLNVMQDGYVVSPNFWTTGLNADAANGISHRFMMKVRSGGSDIDGRRLIGMTREFGSTYSEFKINGTARGNNVMALTYATDLNNQTAIGTVKGWTTVSNTEGYRAIDVNNDTVDEYYYSEWNKAAYTINQFYERMKWLSRRSTSEDSCIDTGSDFAIGNGTITGQAQSFANGVNDGYLTRVSTQMKKVGSPTGSVYARVYGHSGVYGTSSVPSGLELTSSLAVDVSKFTTSYQTIEFGFKGQQLLSASTNYTLSFEYPGGHVSNYIHVRGLATSRTHAGNRSQYNGSWSASASDDLMFDGYTSPKVYGISGERFRGITHQITVNNPSGTFQNVEPVTWSGGVGQMLAIDSTTSPTAIWIQLMSGVAPTDTQIITGGWSGATCTVNTTVTERTLSFPFCGASTGSAIIGSYGFGIEYADLSANDKLFDLTNTQRTPPNNVTFTVYGLENGEDRVLVGPATGSDLQLGQFTLNGALTGGDATITVGATIPTDTPSSGTIRVLNTSNVYARVTYTGYSGTQFTGCTGAPAADNGANVFISYIDKLCDNGTPGDADGSLSFTGVFSSPRSLFIRVRDGGGTPIKTFETTGTLGSGGGSATAIRTADA